MSLKYVAAYLMAVTAGNECPKSGDVESILEAIGADVDDQLVKKLMDEMSGKSTHEVISAGLSKLQSVPSGGSGGAAPAVSGVGAAGAVVAAEEEAKEEEPEEEEDDMGFSLFD